jgi:hypothetical protein
VTLAVELLAATVATGLRLRLLRDEARTLLQAVRCGKSPVAGNAGGSGRLRWLSQPRPSRAPADLRAVLVDGPVFGIGIAREASGAQRQGHRLIQRALTQAVVATAECRSVFLL